MTNSTTNPISFIDLNFCNFDGEKERAGKYYTPLIKISQKDFSFFANWTIVRRALVYNTRYATITDVHIIYKGIAVS